MERTLAPEQLAQATQNAQKLAGTLGTYGLTQSARHARELALLLVAPHPLSQSDLFRITELLLAIRNEVEQTTLSLSSPFFATHVGMSVLLVSEDQEFVTALSKEADAHSLALTVAQTPASAHLVLSTSIPSVAVLDLTNPHTYQEALALLHALSARPVPVPVLAVSGDSTVRHRAAVARLGAHGFYAKDTPPKKLLDTIVRVIDQSTATMPKVLAVDHDPNAAVLLKTLLPSAGFQVTVLTDPNQVHETLDKIAPDLLLLNLHLPHMSGTDLCRMIRADPHWSPLPILILTSTTTRQCIQEVFDSGADDYIVTPIIRQELTVRLRNQVERVQLQHGRSRLDPLTGALLQQTANQALERLLRLGHRQAKPLALGIVDLDQLNTINEQYGAVYGDLALRHIGDRLRQSLRGEDVVGRLGGDEFLVGLYGASRHDAAFRLDKVLEELRTGTFLTPEGHHIRLSFSAGVAQYPVDATSLPGLYEAASEALAKAKQLGRNQIITAGTNGARSQLCTEVDVTLVEEDEVFAELVLHMLATSGYRTHWIANGAEAVTRLGGSTPSLRTKVLLLGDNLAGLNGLTVLRQLEHDGISKTTHIIMLTVRASESEIIAAFELGAFDHVSKPCSLSILLHRIRRALGAMA